MTKEKEVVNLYSKDSYKKKKEDSSITFTIKDKESFYKDSPVKEEKVIMLNAYSKKYVEDNLKATTVFAVDAFKDDEDIDKVEFVIPYQEDNVRIVYLKDSDEYSTHTDYEIKHMSHSSTLKSRTKALMKAMAED